MSNFENLSGILSNITLFDHSEHVLINTNEDGIQCSRVCKCLFVFRSRPFILRFQDLSFVAIFVKNNMMFPSSEHNFSDLVVNRLKVGTHS